MNDIAIRQLEYERKYKEIIVTCGDGSKKTFQPHEWALFEKGVRKISQGIEFVEK